MSKFVRSNPGAAAFVTLALTQFAFSQSTSTEIPGLVTDSSGAVVQGARVVITRVATQRVQMTLTSNSGEYSFPLIEIGEYTVHVEKPGLRSRTITGLRIETQQKACSRDTRSGLCDGNRERCCSRCNATTKNAAIGQ
jgi:hypothetical protein